MLHLAELGLIARSEKRPLLHRLIVQFVCALVDNREAQPQVEATVYAAASYANGSGDLRQLRPWLIHTRYATDNGIRRRGESGAQLAFTIGYHVIQAALRALMRTGLGPTAYHGCTQIHRTAMVQ